MNDITPYAEDTLRSANMRCAFVSHGSTSRTGAAALLRLGALLALLAVSACQRPAASEEGRAVKPAAPERSAAADSLRFDSPEAVYKRYAEAFNASRWSDVMAVYTQTGKVGLILANFKGLALLAATQHPKQQEYKAVLREFCKLHALRCANEGWSAAIAPTLLARGDVTKLMSDVASLAAAKPDETYANVMTMLKTVDPNAVVPLDPTLTGVTITNNTATGLARRADGKTSIMDFAKTSEHGWLIGE